MSSGRCVQRPFFIGGDMQSYWDTVPKGTWTVVDPDDALLAIKDQESRASLVTSPDGERVHIYGPSGKALILDISKMHDMLGVENFREFKKKLFKYLPS